MVFGSLGEAVFSDELEGILFVFLFARSFQKFIFSFLLFGFPLDEAEELVPTFEEIGIGEAWPIVGLDLAEIVHVQLNRYGPTWRMKLSYLWWRKWRGSTSLVNLEMSRMTKQFPSECQSITDAFYGD
jgi:hypothetical protein